MSMPDYIVSQICCQGPTDADLSTKEGEYW